MESSSNVEDALRRCESLESMLAEERMRLLSKVEEASEVAARFRNPSSAYGESRSASTFMSAHSEAPGRNKCCVNREAPCVIT